MLGQNFRTVNVFKENLVRNRDIGKHLGLKRDANAVLDVMTKQGITKDPNKLEGYKKKEFVNAVKKTIGIGYYAKKAIMETYGEKKATGTSMPRTNMADENAIRRKRYDEIMSKGRSSSSEKSVGNSIKSIIPSEPKGITFRSNLNIRNAEGLIVKAEDNNKPHMDSNHPIAGNEDNISRLRDIQSS